VGTIQDSTSSHHERNRGRTRIGVHCKIKLLGSYCRISWLRISRAFKYNVQRVRLYDGKGFSVHAHWTIFVGNLPSRLTVDSTRVTTEIIRSDSPGFRFIVIRHECLFRTGDGMNNRRGIGDADLVLVFYTFQYSCAS